MKKAITSAACALLALCVAVSAPAANFGYCTDAAQRSNIFRLGSTERQGMAIRLGSDKLSALKGSTISGIQAAIGSRQTTGGKITVFVAPAPDSAPLASAQPSVSSVTKWADYAFDTPYTITGDEGELYIGYYADINTNSSMLMADFTADSQGCCYAYNDGAWVDMYGLGCGNASIKAIIDGAPAFTDLSIKPVAISGYFKAGTPYVLSGQLYNFGTEPATSFDIVVTVGDNAPETLSYANVDLRQGQVMDFVLPEFISGTEGEKAFSVDVVNVNGGDDLCKADNAYGTLLYYYPADMERSILLEGFTGETCPNCPAAHIAIERFLEGGTTTPVIEVMHHSGFANDQFTMEADLDYTYFYGGTRTFAPAMMMNRTYIPTLSETGAPVLNVSEGLLKSAFAAVESAQPYASLGIESTYDPATREVKVRFTAHTHCSMPSALNLMNVMLVQDNMPGIQLPYGDIYNHNAVCRGVVTGNSWGILMDAQSTLAGGTYEWETSFILPEGILSDGNTFATEQEKAEYTLAAVPEDMHLVAYVGAYAEGNFNAHTIYNAVSAPLGQSHIQGGITSIRGIAADSPAAPAVSVLGGRLHISGDYDAVEVYSADGRKVNASAALQPGIYVVGVHCGGHRTVKKILVK